MNKFVYKFGNLTDYQISHCSQIPTYQLLFTFNVK